MFIMDFIRIFMLRESYIQKYEIAIIDAYKELIKKCQFSMFHSGDLLLCQQNGNMLHGHTCIGPGKEGQNSFQQVNTLIDHGLAYITNDEGYFEKYGRQICQDKSELPESIRAEMNSYQGIWENVYFLRTLTEVVRVANGERYDWTLDMYNINTSKSNFIRDRIIKKLDVCPKFKEAIYIAYHTSMRNAVAHSQYHLIDKGIMFDNYNPNKPGDIQAIGFADWEKCYTYSYFIFRGLFSVLWDLVNQLYLPLTKKTISGGVPILAYYEDGTWDQTYIYPDETGRVWRFCK